VLMYAVPSPHGNAEMHISKSNTVHIGCVNIHDMLMYAVPSPRGDAEMHISKSNTVHIGCVNIHDMLMYAVPSPRGDAEILGYCMLQWLCGCLPWEDNLENKNYVRDQKIR